MDVLLAATQDIAFERPRLGGSCDEQVAVLEPVEFDLVLGKVAAELVDEEVRDAGMVRIRAEAEI